MLGEVGVSPVLALNFLTPVLQMTVHQPILSLCQAANMPRIPNQPSHGLGQSLLAVRSNVVVRKRLIHPSPPRQEENAGGTTPSNSTAQKPSQQTPATQQRRSALALRQVQRLGSNRARQGIIGITKGGFEPKEGAATTQGPGRSSLRITRVATQQPQPTIRRSVGADQRSSRPAPAGRSVVPKLHVRRSTSPRPNTFGADGNRGSNNGMRNRDNNRSGGASGSRTGRRKTKGGGSGNSAQALRAEEKASEELFWMSYERPLVDEAEHVPYNPGVAEHDESLVIEQSTLATSRTASFAGATGPASEMSAALGRLAQRTDTTWAVDAEIARRLLSGKVVRFKDADEQARVLALAEQMAIKTAWAKAQRKNTPFTRRDVSFVPIAGAHRQKLVNRVIKGQYELHNSNKDKTAASQTLGKVQTALQMKETYTPTASKAFLETFQKLWPAQAAQKSNADKNKRKA